MSAKSMQIGQNWSQKNLFRAGSYRLAFSRKKNYAVKTGGNGFFTRIPTSKPCSKIRPKFAKVDAENFILRAKNSPLGTDFAFKKWVLRTLLTGWPWRQGQLLRSVAFYQGQPVRSVRKTHYLKREKFCKVKKNCRKWQAKSVPTVHTR